MGRIVVTGGLGFIGSHVVDAYLATGNSVTIIDSEIAAVIDGVDYEVHPNCTVVRKSAEDFFDDGGSIEDADRVVHAAAHVGSAGILRYAGRLGPEIVGGTEYVLKACLAADVPVCVFSSAEVYGRSGLLNTQKANGDGLPYMDFVDESFGPARALRAVWKTCWTKASSCPQV